MICQKTAIAHLVIKLGGNHCDRYIGLKYSLKYYKRHKTHTNIMCL